MPIFLLNDEAFTILGNEGDHLDLFFYMFNLRSNIEPVKKLLSRCLSKMGKVVPEAPVNFLLVTKKIITKPEITLLALEAPKGILMLGGLISLVVYVGHLGGRF
ncbi:hypothetical protein CMV_010628 [Castanea mollissima]|uniref:Uncharacterized protein n=1 Tax=Castanea mollissima TaxID=60419 RepID=A0A8J4W0L5_9ROSI|nr:hypothetical protein CMV_010628 [Castanea mollissima]